MLRLLRVGLTGLVLSAALLTQWQATAVSQAVGDAETITRHHDTGRHHVHVVTEAIIERPEAVYLMVRSRPPVGTHVHYQFACKGNGHEATRERQFDAGPDLLERNLALPVARPAWCQLFASVDYEDRSSDRKVKVTLRVKASHR